MLAFNSKHKKAIELDSFFDDLDHFLATLKQTSIKIV